MRAQDKERFFARVCPGCFKKWENYKQWQQDTLPSGTIERPFKWESLDKHSRMLKLRHGKLRVLIRQHECGGEMYNMGDVIEEGRPEVLVEGRAQ